MHRTSTMSVGDRGDSATTPTSMLGSVWRSIGRTAPLLFAIFFFLVCTYFDGVMQVVTERRAAEIAHLPPLPDLGHSIFPFIPYSKINDIYLGLFALATLIRFAPVRTLRWTILRRYLFLQGFILLLRSISIVLTSLSIPLRDCSPDVFGSPFLESFYIFALYATERADGLHHTCADILFSGHTATLTLLALTWTHYSRGEELQLCCDCRGVPYGLPELSAVGDPDTCSAIAVLVWFFAAFGIFLIISTHFHYSIDCFVGFCLMYLLFRVYHYYIKVVLEQRNYMAKFFVWFEGLNREPSSSSSSVATGTAFSTSDEAREATVLAGVPLNRALMGGVDRSMTTSSRVASPIATPLLRAPHATTASSHRGVEDERSARSAAEQTARGVVVADEESVVVVIQPSVAAPTPAAGSLTGIGAVGSAPAGASNVSTALSTAPWRPISTTQGMSVGDVLSDPQLSREEKWERLRAGGQIQVAGDIVPRHDL